MKKDHILNDDNVGKLLVKMSLPAIVGTVVVSVYNIVDTIFIGRIVGTLAIAGIAIAFPFHMIIGAFGQMIGVGGASLLSRTLGANDYNKANKILGNVVLSASFLGLILTILSLIYLDELLTLFGATETILPFARDYTKILLLGSFCLGLAMALNNLMRAEGRAKIAMFTMIIGAVLNIILDALFIYGLNMGIRGAAIATVLAHVVTTIYIVLYIFLGKSSIKFRFRCLKFDYRIQKEIFGIGISIFVRHTAMSLFTIIMNATLAVYGGDLSIAAYGIIMRLVMFIFMPIIGLAQGMQPVAGYNYGAKNYVRLKESVRLSMIFATLMSLSGALILFLFPEILLGVFSNDELLIQQGSDAMRVIIIAFPTVGFQVICGTIFQAMGKVVPNFILSLSRQVLLLIPLVLILPRFFDLTGVWVSFPIADALSAILSLVMVLPLKQKYQAYSKLALEG